MARVASKVTCSVTLDADLVQLVGEDNLSRRVNEALRRETERDRRLAALGTFLDRLAGEEGPLDSAEDLAEMRRAGRLLGASDTELDAAFADHPAAVAERAASSAGVA